MADAVDIGVAPGDEAGVDGLDAPELEADGEPVPLEGPEALMGLEGDEGLEGEDGLSPPGLLGVPPPGPERGGISDGASDGCGVWSEIVFAGSVDADRPLGADGACRGPK